MSLLLPDLQDLSFTLSGLPQPRETFFVDTNQKNNHMKKYITKDQLADFVIRMWDANIRVDLRPSSNSITLWTDTLGKHTFVTVGNANYEEIVTDVINELKEA